jgi:hypothetical protein
MPVGVHQVVALEDHGEVGQVLDRVVGHVLREHRAGHHACIRDHADGVAVLGRLGQGVGADALPGAGLVPDDHGLSEQGAGLGGDQAGITVHDAGRERHDHGDRFVGVIGLRAGNADPQAGAQG